MVGSSKQSSSDSPGFSGGGGGEAAHPIMAYTGRLFLEGIPFQASDISKAREFTS